VGARTPGQDHRVLGVATHARDACLCEVPYELRLAFRYLYTGRKNNVLLAILGVVLGVAALTTVLAVTTGFQNQFRDKVLGVNAHVIATSAEGTFPEYREVMRVAKLDPEVVAVQPFIFTEMLASGGNGKISGVGIKGVDPSLVRGVLDLDRYMEAGSVDSLNDRGPLPPIIVGKELASKLSVWVGSAVTVVVPLSNIDLKTGRATAPRSYQFRVTGIFYSGFAEYDRHLMYTSLRAAQALVGHGDEVMGVEMKVANVMRADKVATHLQHELGPPYSVEDWNTLNANLFDALKIQKFVLVIILTLIIIVATVNLVSSLTMMVTDKTREIAMLKSMGSTSSSIARVFVCVGVSIGAIGTVVGVGLGLAFCYLMNSHGLSLDPRVYLIDHLPVEVRYREVALVAGITLAVSLGATLLPSRTASALTPVEGLRYD